MLFLLAGDSDKVQGLGACLVCQSYDHEFYTSASHVSSAPSLGMTDVQEKLNAVVEENLERAHRMWLAEVTCEVNVMFCSTTHRQKWARNQEPQKLEMQLGFSWVFVCLVLFCWFWVFSLKIVSESLKENPEKWPGLVRSAKAITRQCYNYLYCPMSRHVFEELFYNEHCR